MGDGEKEFHENGLVSIFNRLDEKHSTQTQRRGKNVSLRLNNFS